MGMDESLMRRPAVVKRLNIHFAYSFPLLFSIFLWNDAQHQIVIIIAFQQTMEKINKM